MKSWVLFSRRTVLLPTKLGCLVGFLLLILILFLVVIGVHPFLSKHDPVQGEVLIVEESLPDWAIMEVIEIYHQGSYGTLIVAGGRPLYGRNALKYETAADLLADKFKRKGIEERQVIMIAVEQYQSDRTLESAKAVCAWLDAQHPSGSKADIVSYGPHSRRTFMIYKRTKAPEHNLGIINIPVVQYNPKRWWASSSGTRDVVGELVAFIYSWVFVYD